MRKIVIMPAYNASQTLEKHREDDRENSEILMQLGSFISSLDGNDYASKYFKSQLIRYFYALKIIRQTIPKGTVLDIGSYPSHIHTCLLDLGYDVDGADIAPERIPDSLAKARSRTIQWNFEKERAPVNKKYDSATHLSKIARREIR